MKPVKTAECELVYRGPTPDIGDLWCHRVCPHEVHSYWKPSDVELQVLNEGGAIDLGVYYEPIPPVSVNVIRPEEIEVTDPRAALQAAACRMSWWRRRWRRWLRKVLEREAEGWRPPPRDA